MSQDAEDRLLGYIWAGWDAFVQADLARVAQIGKAEVSLERSITQLLVPHVRKAMPAASPFEIEHGPFEFETLAKDEAQPPQPDMGFMLLQNRRIMWPIEAKVLKTDGSVSEYVKEINDNFLTCRYGPFVPWGGMLGYLVCGQPVKAFKRIAARLKCRLNVHPGFSARDHRISKHRRKVPAGKKYPLRFRCQHMLVELNVASN